MQNRRSVLTLVAGGGHKIAGASASPPDDPIYAAIERHKAAGIVWYAAVDLRSNFPDLHMTVEQRRQRDVLDAADHGGDAQETMAWIDAFLDTLAGAAAALARQEDSA